MNPYKWLFDSSGLIFKHCSMFEEDVVYPNYLICFIHFEFWLHGFLYLLLVYYYLGISLIECQHWYVSNKLF
jgi:hypothetical protein